MMRRSSPALWPGMLAVALFLPALGNGCSSSLKVSPDAGGPSGGAVGGGATSSGGQAGGASAGGSGGRANGGAGGGGNGGTGTGGAGAGGSGGRGTGGVGTGGSGGSGTGGAGAGGGGGSSSIDGGIPCPPDAGAIPFLFCVDRDVYEGLTLCSPGSECACVTSVLRHCDFGCIRDEFDRPTCALPDASPDLPPAPPEVGKLDALTINPPDGANLQPGCPPGEHSGFRQEFCYGNGLFESALACPASAPCNCVAMFRAYCANRCVEHADESAECQ